MTLLSCSDLDLRVGDRVLVRGLSFTVSPGERWAVLGPNGAGKSTLLAVLAGVRPPDGGQVQLEGRTLARWRVQALAERRALVADRWLDPFAASVLDTVLTARYRFGADDAQGLAAARAALAVMDCAHLETADVRYLSRGERQRVGVATALAQDTPLLLLDEPVAHQDPRHRGLVIEGLTRLPGRTLLATLHDPDGAARLATHALLLDGCGGWCAGPCAQVLTAPALSALYGISVQAVRLPGGNLHFDLGGSS